MSCPDLPLPLPCTAPVPPLHRPPLQAQDFRIQYDSIVRVFLLPKANVPQTLVVISLDPPIRKGQTFYNHILCQVGVGGQGLLGGEGVMGCGGVGVGLEGVWRGLCKQVPHHTLCPTPLAPTHHLPPCVPPRLPPLQFPSDEEAEVELDISEEALAAKNEKVGWAAADGEGLLL